MCVIFISRIESGFSEYLQRVKDGEEIGVFQEDIDLSASKKSLQEDEIVAQHKQRDNFEVQSLLFEGQTTGWGRCVGYPQCQERLQRNFGRKIWMLQDNNGEGIKPKYLRNHLLTYHRTDEEEKNFRRRPSTPGARSSSQSSMLDYVKDRFALAIMRMKQPFSANPGNKIQTYIEIRILILKI